MCAGFVGMAEVDTIEACHGQGEDELAEAQNEADDGANEAARGAAGADALDDAHCRGNCWWFCEAASCVLMYGLVV